MKSAVNISLPNITGATDREQLQQMRSYLYQIADQLRWALNTDVDGVVSNTYSSGIGSITDTEKKTQDYFNQIKSLIIGSADIIEAYGEAITKKLRGEYVAESVFGTFRESTEAALTATSTGLQALFENMQQIFTEGENHEIYVTANIKAGLLGYDGGGVPIYGLEVGEKTSTGFNKYARFTSDELAFYDGNDTKVAWISDYSMHITNAVITGNLTLGRYFMSTANGLAYKWV